MNKIELEEFKSFRPLSRGDIFLTHIIQKHLFKTSSGALVAAVHEIPYKSRKGFTSIYRKDPNDNFRLMTVLSDLYIKEEGDINAGIIVEDSFGNLYATGHSNPHRGLFARAAEKIPTRIGRFVKKGIQKYFTKPLKLRTSVLFKSVDDGRSWFVLKNNTSQNIEDPPHPHNLFWDEKREKLWWLLGHDCDRLQQYDPKEEKWMKKYKKTILDEEKRIPIVMARGNGRLWLGCKITGPDSKQLFYSEDFGDTWTKVEQEFVNPVDGRNDGIWSISFDSKGENSSIYVGGGRNNPAVPGRSFVMKSDNNGETWDIIYSGKRGSIATTEVVGEHLFITDGLDIFHSDNKGEKITPFFRSRETLSKKSKDNLVQPGVKIFGNDFFVIDKSAIYKANL